MKQLGLHRRKQTWELFQVICSKMSGLSKAEIEVDAGVRPGFLDRALNSPDSLDWGLLRDWCLKRLGKTQEAPKPVVTAEETKRARSHLVIPDTQVKPGVDTRHLEWIGHYIVERKPDVVIHLGDHWDMPSLSSYDGKGSRTMEGKRYRADVDAGNAALRLLREPASQAKLPTEFYLLGGNHDEGRIDRALELDPKLEGTIELSDLQHEGWTWSHFLQVLELDGIAYSHYFYHPMTSNALTGSIDSRLKHIGRSFTMGHQQTLLTGMRFVGGKQHRGLVAGACYLHDEGYKGPQGNAHWRGVICKHEVNDGQYDIMEVSLNYLCRRYEGCSLEHYKEKNK